MNMEGMHPHTWLGIILWVLGMMTEVFYAKPGHTCKNLLSFIQIEWIMSNYDFFKIKGQIYYGAIFFA